LYNHVTQEAYDTTVKMKALKKPKVMANISSDKVQAHCVSLINNTSK